MHFVSNLLYFFVFISDTPYYKKVSISFQIRAKPETTGFRIVQHIRLAAPEQHSPEIPHLVLADIVSVLIELLNKLQGRSLKLSIAFAL